MGLPWLALPRLVRTLSVASDDINTAVEHILGQIERHPDGSRTYKAIPAVDKEFPWLFANKITDIKKTDDGHVMTVEYTVPDHPVSVGAKLPGWESKTAVREGVARKG